MIEFRKVCKRYDGSRDVLQNIDLTITRGELIFLAGPSGAGKSTLLKLVAALTRPTAGTVLLNGEDVGRLRAAALPYLRRRIGLIFQDHGLLPDRSVAANVMLPLLVTGETFKQAKRRALAALDKVGLAEKAESLPPSLSGGEQQRAAVARAIVNRPQLILADEPTANLDRANADRILDALRSFHSAGVTCVISTHDEKFLRNASRAVFLDQGNVVDTWHGTQSAAPTGAGGTVQ